MLKQCMIPGRVEAGCDEAGRGCLAGPVTAAAVILPEGYECDALNDSKQLSESARERLRPVIERDAVAWAVAMVEPREIDSINILRASILAMHRALDALDVVPDAVLVDGNRFSPWRDVPYTTVIKGDAAYQSIAAASILAKTHRDELMCRLAEQYPQYGWARNKGYPTADHREAIKVYGACRHHRMTFRLLERPTLFD